MSVDEKNVPADAGIRDKRIRWLCRRGMKELDIMLGRYLDSGYPQAPEAERAAFRNLLEVDDPTLWDWLGGSHPVDDPQFEAIVARLRSHR